MELEEKIAEGRAAYYNQLAEKAKYDKEAFGDIYDYYFPRVYSFILAKVKNSHQADDIISSTFERVLLKLDDYNCQRGAFSTWIFRIAINEMNNAFRKTKNRHEAAWEDFFNPADSRHTPEQKLVVDEGDGQLLVAMEKLGERERKIVLLKYFAGMSNKEIAEMLELTATNVGVVLHRSLDKLKKLLEADKYIR